MVEQIKKYLIGRGVEQISTNCFGNDFIEVNITPKFDEKEFYINVKKYINSETNNLTKIPLFSFWAYSIEDFEYKFEMLRCSQPQVQVDFGTFEVQVKVTIIKNSGDADRLKNLEVILKDGLEQIKQYKKEKL